LNEEILLLPFDANHNIKRLLRLEELEIEPVLQMRFFNQKAWVCRIHRPLLSSND